MKNIFFILLLLSIFGCAHIDYIGPLETSGFLPEEKSILQNDMNWLFSFKERMKNPLVGTIILELKSIRKTEDNCDPGQVACTKLFFPNTIFLREGFFKMTQSMRISTLLHEQGHHHYRYYSHENCAEKGQEADYNCDFGMKSAYGIEVQFYKELVELFSQEKIFKAEYDLVSKFIKNNR